VKVNDQLRFDVVLDVGNVNEKVEISANAVQVQTENTQLGDVIDSKKMLALPLNGRSYIDLLACRLVLRRVLQVPSNKIGQFPAV